MGMCKAPLRDTCVLRVCVCARARARARGCVHVDLFRSYDGEFVHGKKHGTGCKSHVAEGWRYEGEWCHDEMTGVGKLVCPRHGGDLRGDVYEGM